MASVEFPALRTTTGEKADNVLLLADQPIGVPICITAGACMPKRIVFGVVLGTVGPAIHCQLLNRKHNVRSN